MRIHGWCEKCHRVKLVQVTGRTFATRGDAITGVCADCQQKEDDRRRGAAGRRTR